MRMNFPGYFNAVADALDQGRVPWRAAVGAAVQADGDRFTAFDRLKLASFADRDPRFLTADQAEALGATVSQNAYVHTVRFVQRRAEGDPLVIERQVVNAADIEGLPAWERPEPVGEGVETVEQMLYASGAEIEDGAPGYDRATDTITLPERGSIDDEVWASMALRQLADASMHESRLNREAGTPEVAALRQDAAAALTCVELGIQYRPDPAHDALISGWADLARNQPGRFAFTSADVERVARSMRTMIPGEEIREELAREQIVPVDDEQMGQVMDYVLDGKWAAKRFANTDDGPLMRAAGEGLPEPTDPEIRMARAMARFEAGRRGLIEDGEEPMVSIVERNLGLALQNKHDQQAEVRITRFLANQAGAVHLRPVSEVKRESNFQTLAAAAIEPHVAPWISVDGLRTPVEAKALLADLKPKTRERALEEGLEKAVAMAAAATTIKAGSWSEHVLEDRLLDHNAQVEALQQLASDWRNPVAEAPTAEIEGHVQALVPGTYWSRLEDLPDLERVKPMLAQPWIDTGDHEGVRVRGWETSTSLSNKSALVQVLAQDEPKDRYLWLNGGDADEIIRAMGRAWSGKREKAAELMLAVSAAAADESLADHARMLMTAEPSLTPAQELYKRTSEAEDRVIEKANAAAATAAPEERAKLLARAERKAERREQSVMFRFTAAALAEGIGEAEVTNVLVEQGIPADKAQRTVGGLVSMIGKARTCVEMRAQMACTNPIFIDREGKLKANSFYESVASSAIQAGHNFLAVGAALRQHTPNTLSYDGAARIADRARAATAARQIQRQQAQAVPTKMKVGA